MVCFIQNTKSITKIFLYLATSGDSYFVFSSFVVFCTCLSCSVRSPAFVLFRFFRFFSWSFLLIRGSRCFFLFGFFSSRFIFYFLRSWLSLRRIFLGIFFSWCWRIRVFIVAHMFSIMKSWNFKFTVNNQEFEILCQ